METLKFDAIETTFTFDAEITQDTMKKFEKKIQQFLNNSILPTTASLVLEHKEIRVMFHFDTTDAPYNYIQLMKRRFDALINWHKEPAMYRWAVTRFVQAAN